MPRILGIDPGLNNTGWGIIDVSGNSMRFIAGGIIKTTNKMPDSERLGIIYAGLEEVLHQYKPTDSAVEEVVVNVNAATSLKLGQARGVALLILGQAGLEVGEYKPLAIKKAVVGYGHAQKGQVQHMVKVLLPMADVTQHDTADALAVAICHNHHMQSPAYLLNRRSKLKMKTA